jgi:hypothetical protein
MPTRCSQLGRHSALADATAGPADGDEPRRRAGLDADNIRPTLGYIADCKREVRHQGTAMPEIWHNYSDINRFESWRTGQLVRALGGQVWLTETGGIVKFGEAFPNRNGSGLTRAAKGTRLPVQGHRL